MIKIIKDGVEREVTKGAFDNLYSKMGYEIVQKKVVVSKPEVTKIVEKEKEEVKEPVKSSKRSSK